MIPAATGGSFNNFLDALDFSYCSYGGGDDYSEDAHYPDHGNRGGYDGPTCGTAKPTHVISTSYGYNEADLSPAYAARQCYEYGTCFFFLVMCSCTNMIIGSETWFDGRDGHILIRRQRSRR